MRLISNFFLTSLISDNIKKNNLVFSDGKVNSICVLLDRNFEFIQDIGHFFHKKNVATYFVTKNYSNVENKPVADSEIIYNYNDKDFNFFGNPKKHLVDVLEDINSDVLLNLSKEQTLKHLYIISKIKSKIKINTEKIDKDHDVYDILITQDKDVLDTEFLQDILNYLKVIKK